MFLEIMIIKKLSPIHATPLMAIDLNRDEANKFFLEKKSKFQELIGPWVHRII